MIIRYILIYTHCYTQILARLCAACILAVVFISFSCKANYGGSI
jgi:hypothetical protein